MTVASGAKRVRVLIVPGFAADTYCEIERSFVELSASAGEGIDVLWLVPTISSKHNVYAKRGDRPQLTEPLYVSHLRSAGVAYVEANISKFNPWKNFRLFRNVFDSHSIDVVYTHFGFERFWAALFAKWFGKIVVWNEHWHSLGMRFSVLKRIFYAFFIDEFVAVSSFIASTLPRNVPVHIVPNAIGRQRLPDIDGAAQRDVRKLMGIASNKIVVLMVAAFRHEKRHDLALEVCRKVFERRDDVVFIFLGDGPLRRQFVDQVGAYGWRQKVFAPGYRETVDDYYAAADIFMLTSINEPFGYVVLEAMRNGLPVIAFRSGGPADVVEDGKTGYLAEAAVSKEFGDWLMELIEHPELRQTMGLQGQSLVRSKYDRALWVRRIRQILRDAAANDKRSVELLAQ